MFGLILIFYKTKKKKQVTLKSKSKLNCVFLAVFIPHSRILTSAVKAGSTIRSIYLHLRKCRMDSSNIFYFVCMRALKNRVFFKFIFVVRIDH